VISNDENLIASCSFDKTVRIWNVKSFDCVKILKSDERLCGVSMWTFNSMIQANNWPLSHKELQPFHKKKINNNNSYSSTIQNNIFNVTKRFNEKNCLFYYYKTIKEKK